MELAGVVVVFFFIGFGIDKALHSGPWFMLGFTVFGIVGTFVRAYYSYSAEMDRLERERRAPRVTAAAPVTEGHAA
jgi:F0F1-type ATP synthase assembly protein I